MAAGGGLVYDGHAPNRRMEMLMSFVPKCILTLGIIAAAPIAGKGIGTASGGPAELTVPGLSAPVEILRDRWGIAHIYARNEHDLFFAQGFNVARDRLFQLELWRRQATGTMAEIQGKSALPRDIGARLLRFRGDMTRELSRYHPRGVEIVGAFVEGINAFIALANREPSRLPIEFQILGIKPGRWTPEVVVSRHNGLFRNVTSEVQVRPARPGPGQSSGPGSSSTCTPATRGSNPTRHSTWA